MGERGKPASQPVSAVKRVIVYNVVVEIYESSELPRKERPIKAFLMHRVCWWNVEESVECQGTGALSAHESKLLLFVRHSTLFRPCKLFSPTYIMEQRAIFCTLHADYDTLGTDSQADIIRIQSGQKKGSPALHSLVLTWNIACL